MRDTVTAPRPGAASLRPARAVSSHVAPRRVHVTPRHVARASHAATHVPRSDAARLARLRPGYAVSGRGGHGAACRVTSATSMTRMPGSATHTLSPLRYIQPRDGGRSWTSLLLWIMPVDLTEVTHHSKIQTSRHISRCSEASYIREINSRDNVTGSGGSSQCASV